MWADSTTVDANASHDAGQNHWCRTGMTPVGEEIWESQGFDAYLVTVLCDPKTRAVRTFYAVRAPTVDRLPRIPSNVRRGVESFVRGLVDSSTKFA